MVIARRRLRSVLSSLVLLAPLLLSACDDASFGPADLALDGSDAGEGADGGIDGAGADLALPLPPVRFRIRFDYRFDQTGFFTDPARRAVLEEAGAIWGRLIGDDFPAIPAGTPIKVRDPQQPDQPAVSLVSDEEIEDLLVFVGSSVLAGSVTGSASPTAGIADVPDAQLAAALYQRFHAADFQPWTGWISFDSTSSWFFDASPQDDSDLPADRLDFLSVALHELGHVLGLGTADAYLAQVDSGAHTFTGTEASATYGAAVPLTTDDRHVLNGTMSGGQRVLMDSSDALGTRYLPTPVDLAMLRDLGYQP